MVAGLFRGLDVGDDNDSERENNGPKNALGEKEKETSLEAKVITPQRIARTPEMNDAGGGKFKALQRERSAGTHDSGEEVAAAVTLEGKGADGPVMQRSARGGRMSPTSTQHGAPAAPTTAALFSCDADAGRPPAGGSRDFSTSGFFARHLDVAYFTLGGSQRLRYNYELAAADAGLT